LKSDIRFEIVSVTEGLSFEFYLTFHCAYFRDEVGHCQSSWFYTSHILFDFLNFIRSSNLNFSFVHDFKFSVGKWDYF
jgi:hypothetical protein